MLRQHISSGTSLAKSSKSTGTLKTIQTLKEKLSKINNMSNDLSDSQLKELANLGHIIKDKVTHGESSGLHRYASGRLDSPTRSINVGGNRLAQNRY